MTGSITARVPAADYHSKPALNISRLKNIDKSGKHFQYFAEHPVTTKPMTLGTACHCAVLEPERFSREFAVWTRRTDGGKMAPRSGQYWLGFLAENPGRTIITQDEYDDAMAMQTAVRADPVAMKYLANGEPEVTMEWDIQGLACRGRVDWLTKINGEPFLVGLKTAREVRHFAFGAAAAKLGYGEQWAWYYEGYKAITGQHASVKEIVVESSAPHDVVVYDIGEDILMRGTENCDRLLQIYLECVASGQWPGIAGGLEQQLSMPSYYYGGASDDLSELGLETET